MPTSIVDKAFSSQASFDGSAKTLGERAHILSADNRFDTAIQGPGNVTRYSGKMRPVADRAALKSCPIEIKTAYLEDYSGRAGVFIYTTGDLSAEVAADTSEGIYIAADGVAATVGAWVRADARHYNVKWFGALGDGTANDTGACQAALDLAAFAGGGEVYFPWGSYGVTELIIASSYTRIRGVGYGTHIFHRADAPANSSIFKGNKAGGTGAPTMRGVSFRHVRLNGMVQTHNWPQGQEYECVNVNNTEDFDFRFNWVENSGQDGLDMDGLNTRAHICNNVFSDCRMQAIHLYGGDYATIDHNHIVGCGWGFVVDPITTGVIDTPYDPALPLGSLHNGTQITNNVLIDCSTGIHILSTTYGLVSGNFVSLSATHTFTDVGMAIWASDPARVMEYSHNVVLGPWDHGIRAAGRIIGNYVADVGNNSESAAIHARPNASSVVKGNIIGNSTGYGIWNVGPSDVSDNILEGAYNNDAIKNDSSGAGSRIVNNSIKGTATGRGINLIGSADVFGNHVSGFATFGIRAEGASAAGSKITGNVVDGGGTATEFGIQAVSGADDCMIDANVVTGITGSLKGGIGITAVEDCTMRGNESRGNYWSMVIGATSPGHVVVNNISRDPTASPGHLITSGSAGTGVDQDNYTYDTP